MAGTQTTITRFAIVAMVLVILGGFLILISMIFSLYRHTSEMMAQNVVLPVRTKLLAEQGIQYAVDRLRRWCLEETIDHDRADWAAVQYRDRDGDGAYSPDQDEVLAYRRDQPLRVMRNPSYAPPHPRSLTDEPIRIPDESGDGRSDIVGFSLRVPSPLDDATDLISLKILDCASMIWVNGPTAGPGDWSLAPNALRLLDNLGATEEVAVPQLGMILNEWRIRHRRGFATRLDVADALRSAKIPERKWTAVLNNVTCHAWVDDRVLHPGALVSASPPGEDACPGGKYRWGRMRSPESDGIRVARGGGAHVPARAGPPALLAGLLPRLRFWGGCSADFLLSESSTGPLEAPPVAGPQPGPPRLGTVPLLQPRAPVNVNTASIEVLAAVFARLEACALDRAERALRPLPSGPGRTRRSPESAVPPMVARIVAEWILSRRSERPFRTWNEFEQFVLGLPEEDVSPLRKRIILAAVNPNSRLSSFNPDRVLGLRHGDVDKASLGDWARGPWNAADNLPFCGWTTEICFSSMGWYQVECLVRLLDAPREGVHPVAAQSSLEAVVQVYDVVRRTTQKDFLAHTVSTSLLPDGSPAVLTWPESTEDLLRNQAGPDGLEATVLRRPERGSAKEEECRHALCWDGHVSLAPRDGPVGAGVFLRAEFGDTLDASAFGRPVPAAGSADMHRSLLDAVDPSELFPDGVFCHETRRLSYSAAADRYGQSLPTLDEHLGFPAPGLWPLEGSLEFWVKPTWNGDELYDAGKPGPTRRAEAADVRTLVSLGRGLGREDDPRAGDRLVVFARRGLLAASWGDPRAEPSPGAFDPAPAALFHSPEHPWCNRFRAVATPIRDWRAGEWHHVRVTWIGAELHLEVDGRRALGPPLRPPARPFLAGIPDGWLLFLGHNRFRDGRCNGHPLNADATLDGLTLSARSTKGKQPPDRYPAGPGPYGLHLRFVPGVDFARDEEPISIASLTWNGRAPSSGGGIALAVGPRPAELASLALPPGPDAASGARAVRLSLPPGAEVFVTCAFFPAAPGPAGMVTESPVLEDLTLTVLRAPRFHSWWMR